VNSVTGPVQRACGEPRRLGQVGDDGLGASVDAAEAVIVVMVPGRVGVQQVAECGEVAAAERAERSLGESPARNRRQRAPPAAIDCSVDLGGGG
jgi:hypothetical protein